MSNIVVGFDLHCWNHKRFGGERKNGVNRRGELCLGTTHKLVDFANEHDAHLVVAGDLVDNPGPVQPQFAAVRPQPVRRRPLIASARSARPAPAPKAIPLTADMTGQSKRASRRISGL